MPRKTKRERLAKRDVYAKFADFRKELVDRNLSVDPGPKPDVVLPKREAKMLSGQRGALDAKSARFRDPWNAPRPQRAPVWRGKEMFNK